MKCTIATRALLVLVLSALHTPADEGPAPPITRETLIGVWEAAPSWAQCVYRLDIAPHTDSYLAFTHYGETLVYRVTSKSVRHGRVVLHFRSVRERRRGCNDLVITGSGRAYSDSGTFEGTLCMYDALYAGAPPEMSSVSLSFTKPPWTRELTHWSQKSEESIKEVRATH
jgi:hypothetical protein